MADNTQKKCDGDVECWSRVSGFFRPVKVWNAGKQQEFKERTEYQVPA